MSQQLDCAALMERLRRGDQSAAGEVFQLFSRRLIGLARTKLDGQMLRKIDPEDVVQSVFKSFFRCHDEGQIAVESLDDLWALLALITLRKCGHKLEHFQAACRNVRREVTPPPSPNSSCDELQAIAREPTPDEAAILNEALANLFSDLDDTDRLILELRLQGHSTAAICVRSGRSERSVYRVLERIRHQLEHSCDSSDSNEAPVAKRHPIS